MRVDFHRHFFNRPEELDMLLAEMERYQIEKTLLLPMEIPAIFMGCTMAGNAKVLEAVNRHPDKLLGAVYVDPRDLDVEDTIRRGEAMAPDRLLSRRPDLLPRLRADCRSEAADHRAHRVHGPRPPRAGAARGAREVCPGPEL